MTATHESPVTTDAGKDFDHWDEESIHSPWARWARLRAQGGLARSEKHDGFFIASTYADVCAIARETGLFSSFPQTSIPEKPVPPFPPMNYDPPEHRGYRTLINPFFSPNVIAGYADWVREAAHDFVARLVASDGFDVSSDLGIPLTRHVILRIMGIDNPPEELNDWSDDLVFHEDAEAGLQIMMLLAGEIAARQEEPRDDLLTALVQGEFQGRPLNDDELVMMAMMVLLAGLETTNSAISAAVLYLVQNPEARARLAAADDHGWRLAMDEFVRWSSPAPALARNVMAETEVSGCPVQAGDKVLLLFGSANRDEAEFESPDDVVLDRYPNRHLGFGIGPHRCVGSHLAKMEMEIVLKALLPHLDEFVLRSEEDVVWVAAEVRGIRSLPLVRR